MDPEVYYRQQKDIYEKELAISVALSSRVAMGRLWVILAAVALTVYILSVGGSTLWWGVAALVVAFVVLVRQSIIIDERQQGTKLCLQLVNNELKAMDGDYSPFADGVRYINTQHPYSYDLDVFGKHSLYQMICRAVTSGGEDSLAAALLKPPLQKEKIEVRQATIKELTTHHELLLQFRVAGLRAKEAPGDQQRLTSWLLSPNVFTVDRLVTVAAVAIPLVSILFIIYSVYARSIFPGLYVMAVLNMIMARRYALKINAVAQQVGNTALLVEKYEKLQRQMAAVSFQQPALQAISDSARQSLGSVAKLRKLVNLFETRGNNMVGPIMNLLFLFNLVCLLRLERWKTENGKQLAAAIDAIIEADMLVSCAVYAFNNPGFKYPAVTGKAVEANGLVHPLLVAKAGVGNDFSLGQNEQFYLLTGANMTGKSTFIRTVGVSIVLFNMGLPLPAREVRLPVVDLYTSMRVTDSVQDDISYFKAELNRIKALMDAVKTSPSPYMVLLDEPLRGTNSTDKQQGTRAIADNLMGYNAIGIIATHDTILCDMEQNYPGKVTNYHFESRLTEKGLVFDFLLKSGPSTSNNATQLMRQMGIITG